MHFPFKASNVEEFTEKVGKEGSLEHVEYADGRETVDQIGEQNLFGNSENEILTRDAMAARATAREKALTTSMALRTQWKAAMWSALVSFAIVMEGYNTMVITSVFAYPSFQEKFGVPDGNGGYVVEAKWQTVLSASISIGGLIGSLICGHLTDTLGHRNALLISILWLTACIFAFAFGSSAGDLLAGLILSGIPCGVIAVTGVTFATESCPLRLRPYLTNFIDFCWFAGQIVCAGVLQGCIKLKGQWSWRLPFTLQWMWIPITLTAISLSPTSPWWLVRRGQEKKALMALRTLNNNSEEENREYVALMVQTNEREKKEQKHTGYLECFKGVDLRRTEIGCVALSSQIWTGSSYLYSPAYLFVNAGISSDESYKLNLGALALGILGVWCSWLIVDKLPRRTIFIGGLIAQALCLIVVGGTTPGTDNQSVAYAQASFAMLWLFSFATTIGPSSFTILGEISSTRLRNKTNSLGRVVYYISQIVSMVLNSYMINSSGWNWKGYEGFFWLGTTAILLIWAFFRLPECRNRTYEEIDVLFERLVPARRFAKTDVSVLEP